MSGFRQEMTARRVRTLTNALAVLAGVLRHDDDPHAVRLTVTSADGEQFLCALNLGLLPLTELVDAVRARSADIARQPKLVTPAQPAETDLRLITHTESEITK